MTVSISIDIVTTHHKDISITGMKMIVRQMIISVSVMVVTFVKLNQIAFIMGCPLKPFSTLCAVNTNVDTFFNEEKIITSALTHIVFNLHGGHRPFLMSSITP